MVAEMNAASEQTKLAAPQFTIIALLCEIAIELKSEATP